MFCSGSQKRQHFVLERRVRSQKDEKGADGLVHVPPPNRRVRYFILSKRRFEGKNREKQYLFTINMDVRINFIVLFSFKRFIPPKHTQQTNNQMDISTQTHSRKQPRKRKRNTHTHTQTHTHVEYFYCVSVFRKMDFKNGKENTI